MDSLIQEANLFATGSLMQSTVLIPLVAILVGLLVCLLPHKRKKRK